MTMPDLTVAGVSMPDLPMPDEALPVGYHLRAGTPADAATLAALSVQVFLDTYAADGVRPDLAAEALAEYSPGAFMQRLHEPGRRFVLVEQEGGLRGFAELRLAPAIAPAGGVAGAELVRLYVQPGAQGRGIGRHLLRAAEALAAAASHRHLWLTAWEGNGRALAFYAAQGYRTLGDTTYHFQGRSYGNRVLARGLAVPQATDAPPASAGDKTLEWSRSLSDVDWHELEALYRRAPLGHKPADHLRHAFGQSRYAWFVRDRGQLVAAGRALADGADCAYLCDLAVLPSHQGSGLGKALVQRLLADCQGHKKILLYAVPGKEPFYRKFGFLRLVTAMAIFQDRAAAIARGHLSEE